MKVCCASALTAGSSIAADLSAVKTKVALLASSYMFFKLLRSKNYQPNLIFTQLLIGPINSLLEPQPLQMVKMFCSFLCILVS